MKKIREYGFLPLYLLLSLAVFFLHPLSGKEVVALPWKTVSYILLFTLVGEGMKKEYLHLPLLKLFNSIRSTPFLFSVILLSTFLLSLILSDYLVIAMLLPFTAELLREARKEKYTIPTAALMTVLSTLTGLISPVSRTGIHILYTEGTGFVSYLEKILLPFSLSLLIFLLEAVLVYRRTRGDEIYLHVENEPYWDKEKRALRILYPSLLLVLIISRRFRAPDIFIIITLILFLFDREVFKKTDWTSFLTVLFILIFSYTLSHILTGGRTEILLSSILMTKDGSIAAFGPENAARVSLPSAFLPFSFPVLTALRIISDRKSCLKECILLSLPHLFLFLLFALAG